MKNYLIFHFLSVKKLIIFQYYFFSKSLSSFDNANIWNFDAKSKFLVTFF